MNPVPWNSNNDIAISLFQGYIYATMNCSESDNQDYRISVVIPTHNVEGYIDRAIDSILAQTEPVDEIIVVDAESTDATTEIVRRYGSPVTLIQQKKNGISAGRNDGIRAARFAWVAFLDGDDEWLPHYVENQKNLLQRNPHLVWSGANFWRLSCDNDQREACIRPEKAKSFMGDKDYFDDYFDANAHGINSQTGGFLIRREILEQVGYFCESLAVAEDTDLFFRIAYQWPQFGYLCEPQTIYRNHRPGGITQQYKTTKEYLDMIDRQLIFSAEHNKSHLLAPVAARIVRGWIRSAVKDERIFEVKGLLKKYSDLLPSMEKFKIRLWTLFPSLTLNWFAFKSKLKSL